MSLLMEPKSCSNIKGPTTKIYFNSSSCWVRTLLLLVCGIHILELTLKCYRWPKGLTKASTNLRWWLKVTYPRQKCVVVWTHFSIWTKCLGVAQCLPCIPLNLTPTPSVLNNKSASTRSDHQCWTRAVSGLKPTSNFNLLTSLHFPIHSSMKLPLQTHVFLTSFPYFPLLLEVHKPPVSPSVTFLASPLSQNTLLNSSSWQWLTSYSHSRKKFN